MILPGFLCADMSLAARAAGKEVIHLDVDASTMQYRAGLLDEWVERTGPERTLVLFDHAFGHCSEGPVRLRKRFPQVSVIEDAVRVSAGVFPACVGAAGDWLLLSMYKVVRGNGPGALLLGTRALELPSTGTRRRASLIRLLRGSDAIAALVRRFRGPGGDTEPTVEDIERVPRWHPTYGLPDSMTCGRFARAWSVGRSITASRRTTWGEIDRLVQAIPAAVPIGAGADGESCSHYTFLWQGTESRDRVLSRLLAAGVPALRTWDQIPYFFRSMRSTYPDHPAGSIELARRVVHLPIAQIGGHELRRLRVVAQTLQRLG